jgi:hypothetical protein
VFIEAYAPGGSSSCSFVASCRGESAALMPAQQEIRSSKQAPKAKKRKEEEAKLF